MNPGKLWIGCAGLAIGLAGGYLIARNAPLSSATDLPHTKSGRVTKSGLLESGRAEARKNDATKKTALSIPAKNDYSGRQEWLESLSLDQLPDVFYSLCANIGPDGLNYQDKSFLESALGKWMKEDQEGALAWASQLPLGATKRYFMKTILGAMLEDNPQQALAVSEALQFEDSEWDHEELQLKFGGLQIDKAWAKPDATASEMLDLYAKLPRGNGSLGTGLKQYPENFDFREFLDGIDAQNQADQKNPRSMPSDVLEKWAKLDAPAAAQWFLDMTEKQHQVNFQNWNDIATAVTKTNGPAAYFEWAADIFSQSTDMQRKAILESTDDQGAMGIARSLSDITLRDQVFAAAARRNSGTGGSGDEHQQQTIQFLSQISSPTARLQAITKDQAQYAWWIKNYSIPASTWQKIGLTQDQVNAALDEVHH